MNTYYTVDQVAAMAQVHKNTVQSWIRTGELKSLKIGHLRRITEEQLNEFNTSMEEAHSNA